MFFLSQKKFCWPFKVHRSTICVVSSSLSSLLAVNGPMMILTLLYLHCWSLQTLLIILIFFSSESLSTRGSLPLSTRQEVIATSVCLLWLNCNKDQALAWACADSLGRRRSGSSLRGSPREAISVGWVFWRLSAHSIEVTASIPCTLGQPCYHKGYGHFEAQQRTFPNPFTKFYSHMWKKDGMAILIFCRLSQKLHLCLWISFWIFIRV